MSIRILLLLTVVGMILITLGLLGLYVDVTRRLNRVNETIRNQRKAISETKDKVKVLEDRDKSASNHVYFCTDNEIDEEPDIKYGGEGI